MTTPQTAQTTRKETARAVANPFPPDPLGLGRCACCKGCGRVLPGTGDRVCPSCGRQFLPAWPQTFRWGGPSLQNCRVPAKKAG